jgi:lipoprotein-releasing system ATP-binding protein
VSVIIEALAVSRVLTDPDPVTLVRDIDLTIETGQMTAIIGPSGCGKSSLLYLLGLLDRPSSGSLLLEGQDTARLDEAERDRMRLQRIGYVFQFHFLLPELTALDNVALPIRRLGRLNPAEAAGRAEELLTKLGLASEIAKRPDQMSGGQRQRVAIARALANDPILVLGDEPTGNLDSQNTQLVISEFQRLAHEEGRAVVCVTHDATVAAAADLRVHMLDGRIVEVD